MGRALFSQKYAPAVTIRTEPEAAIYTTWSRWNNFDPDSNEFFVNAEREVFTDTPEYQRELEELRLRDATNPTIIEPASSVSTSFEPASSMPVQPITSGEWQDRFLTAGATSNEWERPGGARTITEPDGSERVIPVYISSGYRSPNTVGYTPDPVSETRHAFRTYDTPPRNIIVGPPLSTTSSNTDSTVEDDAITEVDAASPPLHSPTFRRMVDIDIPPSPSPDSPASPATPTDQTFNQMMFAPSPPPSVSPRFVSWNHRQAPTVSPTHHSQRPYPLAGHAPRLRLATAVATRGVPFAMVAGRV